jgi:hypothetical protein
MVPSSTPLLRLLLPLPSRHTLFGEHESGSYAKSVEPLSGGCRRVKCVAQEQGEAVRLGDYWVTLRGGDRTGMGKKFGRLQAGTTV